MHAKYTVSLLFAALIGVSCFTPAAPAHAAVKDWQRGATIVPRSPTDFASPEMKQSLQQLASTGANFVSFNIPYEQHDDLSLDIHPSANAPTDAALTAAITEAHQLGLAVELSFYDTVPDRWRAYINPIDRDGWFNNYQTALLHYSTLGEQNHVEQLCLGAELSSMTSDSANPTNTAHWVELIHNVRQTFSGKLTYYANWNESGYGNGEKSKIKFWDLLDYVGETQYPTFNIANDYDKAGIMSYWDYLSHDIIDFQHQYNKPFLFGEIGYRSIKSAVVYPWDYSPARNSIDLEAQATAYDAFMQYWDQHPEIGGVHWWNWQTNPAAGGVTNTDYTPQNKPAQNIMAKWFGGTVVLLATSSPVSLPLYLNAGGGQFIDANNTTWITDSSFSGGDTFVSQNTIANTSNERLYQSERFGDFSYNFSGLSNGTYDVTLKFAEIYWQLPGQRVFNVQINGQRVLDHFDIVADAGGPNRADDKTFPVTVTGGTLSIGFSSVIDKAKISGITITPHVQQSQPPVISSHGENVQAGVNVSVSNPLTISNSGGDLTNAIVDAELYDANGQKVSQQYSDRTAIPGNSGISYVPQWTISTPGVYTVKVGVFSAQWQSLLSWNNQAGTISVSGDNPPTPPPSTNPPPSNTIDCSTIATNAFTACYFSDKTLTTPKVSRTDNAINFDWGMGSPDPAIPVDGFSARWEGNVTFQSGDYTFTTTADDGVRVYIDNQLVLDKWIDQPATTYNVTRTMTAGTHTIKMEYYENGGNAVAKLNWAQSGPTPPVITPPPDTGGGGTSTNSGSAIVIINGYPTLNGNYIDCNGTIDNDMGHHTTNTNDTDPAHHVGQNCSAGSYVATHSP